MTSFVQPHDPILTKRAEEVFPKQFQDPEIQKLINNMFEIARGEQGNPAKPILVGLAAPQIGVSKRVILVDTDADGTGKTGNLQLFINPEIISVSEETSEWREGCFSTSRVCGIVERPNTITVTARLIDGSRFTGVFTGYIARIFQHEIDHLDGKEFVQHISDPGKLHWVDMALAKEYRERWRDWPHKCTFEEWAKIKRGEI